MNNIINSIKYFLINEDGAETAEWAVIVGLLALMGITIYAPGGSIGLAITGIGAKITAAITTA